MDESQQFEVTRPLICLQYHVPSLSRLQRIYPLQYYNYYRTKGNGLFLAAALKFESQAVDSQVRRLKRKASNRLRFISTDFNPTTFGWR